MTTADLARYLGQSGTLTTAEGLSVAVSIIDARNMFGRIDLLVTPEAGEGQAWVSEGRVTIK
jgi:hypothetical protein